MMVVAVFVVFVVMLIYDGDSDVGLAINLVVTYSLLLFNSADDVDIRVNESAGYALQNSNRSLVC